ncbi:MAG: SufE family protein [Oceanococcus sp.]
MTLQDLQASFELMGSWEERYGLIIDLGKQLKPLPEDAYNEANKVRGCMSQVWMTSFTDEDGRIQILGDSDAYIVKGLIAVLLIVFSGKTAQEIGTIDIAQVFGELGLEQHISANRRNGFYAMVQRVSEMAAQA